MRDINIPRSFGIPNPFAYQRLCECLKDNWPAVQNHFHLQTDDIGYKISRIHLRKMKGCSALFKMNYQDWRMDDDPVPGILIGKQYMVKADISTCFPSMYTHALGWALEGKKTAKGNKNKKDTWPNSLDHAAMNMRNGETHGFMIGPHASNLMAEIILTVIDHRLNLNEWHYIRNIDDYSCYVDSYEAAQSFLTDLQSELRQFDLMLNHKKTRICSLPVATTEHWVRRLQSVELVAAYGKVNYKAARGYLDLAISLMEDNGGSAAILNYAIKVLAKQPLTDNARKYCAKTLMHYAYIYPYLLPLMEEYVFQAYDVDTALIANFTKKFFHDAMNRKNYEALSYALYFAIKYEFIIPDLNCEAAIQSDSCIFKLLTWLYFKDDAEAARRMKKHAREDLKNSMDEYWLFVYEILPQNELSGEWKPMKRAGISFIRPDLLTMS